MVVQLVDILSSLIPLVHFGSDPFGSQQPLTDEFGVRVLQTRCYESGASQPTLDAITRLVLVLGVTTDELIFVKDERGLDEDFRLQFEAITRFTPE